MPRKKVLSKNDNALHNLLALRMISCSGADDSFLGKYVKLKTLQNLANSSRRNNADNIDASSLLMLGYLRNCNNNKSCIY